MRHVSNEPTMSLWDNILQMLRPASRVGVLTALLFLKTCRMSPMVVYGSSSMNDEDALGFLQLSNVSSW